MESPQNSTNGVDRAKHALLHAFRRFHRIISTPKDRWKCTQVAAIVLLALACAYAISSNRSYNAGQLESTRKDQQAGCVRTNDFRAQINRQNAAFLVHNEVTFKAFIEIRDDPGIPQTTKDALRVAVVHYKRIAHEYEKLPLIDCAKAYPMPGAPPRPKNTTVDSVVSKRDETVMPPSHHSVP